VLTSLAVLAGLLAIALVFADEVRREAAHTVLTAELAVAKAAAEATKTLEAKADLLVQSRSFLPAQRRDKALSPVFEELARILPDDTWLTSTSIDGEVIRIQGSSLAADRLIQTIDASPLFADAQFAAPVVRSPGATTDRFDITMKHRHGVAK
jgi:general secretion pathway protein L